jgi:hypothetical protein
LKTAPYAALLACLIFAPLAHGASESEPPSGQTPVPQVMVEANRANLVKLGKEIQLHEVRFYELYNTLNKDRRYAINCGKEARTGSRFEHTECQPVFVTDAEHEEAREFLIAIGGGDQASGTPGGVTGPAVAGRPAGTGPVAAGSYAAASPVIEEARPGFKQNMRDVTSRSPALTKMAQKHAAMWKRYEAMYKRLKDAPPAEEKSSGDSK